MADVELVVDLGAPVAEGPLWDEATGRLICVDIVRGLVHRWDPATGDLGTVEVGQPVGVAVRRRRGGLLAGARDGLMTVDDQAAPLLVVPLETDRPANRCNDGKCDALGRLWVGTMAEDQRPGAGALYRVEPDLTCQRVLDDVTISNGLGWSPDLTTMYYIDTPTKRVDAFDFDLAAGRISSRRALLAWDGPGAPDGMTVDAEGYLWVAGFDSWVVRRYSPEGRLDLEIRLPVAKVTSCAFGGDGYGELYITTAAVGLDEAELAGQPGAGGVFRCKPGMVGLPPATFAG